MGDPVKILVLGAGGAAANGFARALRMADGGYELIGANCSDTDLLLSECDDNQLIAPASDFNRWSQDVDRLVRTSRIDFVHAQNDAEVEALGRIRRVMHLSYAKTWLPSQTTIEICRDKWVSYKLWRDGGLRVPFTSLDHDVMEGDVWMRPRVGAGGQKSLRTANQRLLRAWAHQHRDTKFTYARALTADTVTVQQLYHQGDLVVSQQRTREAWANAGSSATGVSGSTGVGVTSSDLMADQVACRAVQLVDEKPHGLYGIDMCRDQDGVPNPTEINIGRFFTTAPEFYAAAGFNIADLYVHGPAGGTMTMNPLPDGLRWVRGMDRPPVLDRSRVRELVAA
jgi:carbamoyl-phosphate synthase large subunit